MEIDLKSPTPEVVEATITGELDADNCHQLGAALLDERSGVLAVVLHLGGVTFLDSSAVSELLRIQTELATDDVAFTLVEVSDQVRRVLEITGLLPTFGLV